MSDHPFAIRRSGNLVSCVTDAAVLFTEVPEPEAREMLLRHLTQEQVDALFASYDESQFKQQARALNEKRRRQPR